MTSLYRQYDDEGRLLYVGISLSWPVRFKQHVSKSEWFEQVARIEIERFDTRPAALVAEKKAIKSEKPKFNIIHNKPTRRGGARRGIKQGDYVAFRVETIFGNKPRGRVTGVYGDFIEVEKETGGLAQALRHEVRKIGNGAV